MRQYSWIITWFLIGFLAACQSTTSKTVPQKNVSYDSYLFECTFQHPREWQVGNAFDSGGVVLMISDADPIEVFGFANRTGNEIVIALFAGGDVKVDFVPATFLEKLGKEPISSKIHEFDEGDKQFAYVLNSGELRAAMINQRKAFYFTGDYPIDRESTVQDGLETILRSFELLEVEGREVSVPMGQRSEGPLKISQTMTGSLPFWARSVWTFEGKAGHTVEISIDSGDSEANLILDILDTTGSSILSEGAISFTGNYDSDPINLPVSGTYTISVSPSPNSKWHGWYKITLQ